MVAQTDAVIKAAVFNMTETIKGRVFAVLKYRYSVVNGEPRWEASRYQMSEVELLNILKTQSLQFINVQAKDGRVVGRGGSLQRFQKVGNVQIVIGVMTTNKVTNNTIGYRVVFRDGTIKAIKLSDIITYCNNASSKGIVPFQNAMFVEGKNSQSQFLRSFTEGDFIIENHIYNTRQKSAVDNSQVPKDIEKKVRKRNITDIYTKEQVKELRLGRNKMLPIRIYANPKLSAEQMRALRMALEKGINPQRYASPEIEPIKMRFFTFQLSKRNRINEYLNPEFSYPQLIRLASAVEMGLNIKTLLNPKLQVAEMDDEIVHLELETYNTINPREGSQF